MKPNQYICRMSNFNKIDDRHEIFNLYLSQCGKCKHFKDGYTCKAYPNGIPDELLDASKQHNEVRKDQIGNTTFTKA